MANYAGFWRRVGAYIIDAIILVIVSGIIGPLIGVGTMSTDPTNLTGNLAANLVQVVIGVAYFAGMESSSWQATLGKKALGLVVTDLNGNRISLGKAVGRYFAKILSAIILLIGFIMVAFTEKKQGLHDMLAGTLVYVGQPVAGGAQVFE